MQGKSSYPLSNHIQHLNQVSPTLYRPYHEAMPRSIIIECRRRIASYPRTFSAY